MKLPPPEPILRVLRQLLTEAPDLKPVQDKLAVTDLGPAYVAVCHDDTGQPMAAIVADLHAALHFAGKLMMVPPGVLKEQAKAGKLEDSLLDALSEVFNNLTKTINNIEGNPHVASKPARSVALVAKEDATKWLSKPSVRVDYTGQFMVGPGRIALVGK